MTRIRLHLLIIDHKISNNSCNKIQINFPYLEQNKESNGNSRQFVQRTVSLSGDRTRTALFLEY